MSTSAPVYESPRDRTALAREAGLGGLSLPSVLAGVLVAYGAFAALVGAVTAAIGLNTDLAGNDRVTLGVGSAIAASQADTDAVQANLRSLGIPTTGTEWGKVGTVDGIGSLAAMLVGALVGGVLGERCTAS
jgi:hypothetical protein